MHKSVTLAVSVGLMAAIALPPLAHAEGLSCTAIVGDKKLAGAAKTSFTKKCESDAKSSCDAAAADKKLTGAAKNSFAKNASPTLLVHDHSTGMEFDAGAPKVSISPAHRSHPMARSPDAGGL